MIRGVEVVLMQSLQREECSEQRICTNLLTQTLFTLISFGTGVVFSFAVPNIEKVLTINQTAWIVPIFSDVSATVIHSTVVLLRNGSVVRDV